MEHHPSERLSETFPAAPPSTEPLEAEEPAAVSSESPTTASAGGNREGWWAAGMALLYLLFYQGTLHIPSEHIGVIWTTTLLALLILLLFTVRVARALRSPQSLAINLILSALLFLPLALTRPLLILFPGWHGWHYVIPAVFKYTFAVSQIGLHSLLLVWFASSLGVLVSRIVREVKMLMPIALALACVDLYVVFGGGGPVKQAVTGRSHVAQAAMRSLTAKLAPPQPHAAMPMQLAVGFADFMFIALFFACLARFRIPARWTFVVLFVLLAVYMVLTSYVETLPALVPIAIVMIGMNLRRFRYSRSEAFALLYAGIIVVAVIGGLFFLYRK